MKRSLQTTSFLLILLIISSCGLTNREPIGYEPGTTIDNAFASSEFSAISNIVDAEGRGDTNVFKTAGFYCPGTIVTSDIISPSRVRLTIDFGTGQICGDGRARAGKLVADFYGRWSEEGSYVEIVPDGYSVNTWPVLFTKTITNNGRNSDGNLTFSTEVVDGRIATPQGTIFYTSERETEWTFGESTPLDVSDNEYVITGTASGTARNTLSFTATIDEPLLVRANCPNIVQGIISITPDNRDTRTIDYGNGGCDNLVTISVGSYTTQITLSN